MTPDDLAALGTATFGHEWQSPLARALGVAPRTVRRWAAGHVAIPDRVADEIRRILGIDETAAGWPRDAWITGDGDITGTGARREYVIHAARPRFIARAVQMDELTDRPEPDEDPADLQAGIVYRAGPDTMLCELVWIDPPPSERETLRLMDAAADALERAGDEQ